ncbi:uncharacterized protein ARMOST_20875 [Armillaria ostoyae]|uniref:Uncharacterized protein n=1 Tax=Armillaria ostoyae TaxID=47428 RepID=A0A284S8I2_ARMOS|nr:uncharacterized protein ARMOST_20875 [Armillaria ostoyae]
MTPRFHHSRASHPTDGLSSCIQVGVVPSVTLSHSFGLLPPSSSNPINTLSILLQCNLTLVILGKRVWIHPHGRRYRGGIFQPTADVDVSEVEDRIFCAENSEYVAFGSTVAIQCSVVDETYAFVDDWIHYLDFDFYIPSPLQKSSLPSV